MDNTVECIVFFTFNLVYNGLKGLIILEGYGGNGISYI